MELTQLLYVKAAFSAYLSYSNSNYYDILIKSPCSKISVEKCEAPYRGYLAISTTLSNFSRLFLLYQDSIVIF